MQRPPSSVAEVDETEVSTQPSAAVSHISVICSIICIGIYTA